MEKKLPWEKEQKPYPMESINNKKYETIDDRFGVVSDTHIGSIFSSERELADIYDTFADNGVKTVYHEGDMTDGFGVYKGQVMNQNLIGYEQQAQGVIKQYPKKRGMKTKFITGNHDTSFTKSIGADIGQYIASQRPDLKYMGVYYARHIDPNDGLKLDQVHGEGNPYQLSYGLQKYIRSSPPSFHPDVLLSGHRHKSMYANIDDVRALEAGCFQEPSGFVIRKGVVSGNMGGWIVDMERKDGKVSKFRPEWVCFDGKKTKV